MLSVFSLVKCIKKILGPSQNTRIKYFKNLGRTLDSYTLTTNTKYAMLKLLSYFAKYLMHISKNLFGTKTTTKNDSNLQKNVFFC